MNNWTSLEALYENISKFMQQNFILKFSCNVNYTASSLSKCIVINLQEQYIISVKNIPDEYSTMHNMAV